MSSPSDLPYFSILFAILLASHGLRRKSLSPSGALAAFIVGSIMMAVPLRVFGVSLIVFYLVGSRATKVGKQRKEALEEGHQEAGYRTANQVLCNSFSAFGACLLWSALFVPGSLASRVLSGALSGLPHASYDFDQWCPLTPPPSAAWSRKLLLVALG